jgi:uncharacterized RDD family membrane protein YckC
LSDRVGTESVEPAYGRFSRRLKAVVIDGIVMLLLTVAALIIAVSTGSDSVGRILGFTVIAIWLLYEPLLVSLTGSTIGHYRTNLRVVDNQTHGNISFLKAVVRVIIKGVLGIYSFITMATTSRHQAVHDLLTGSTVQIRDRSKARSGDYVTARTGRTNPGMPSAGRRLLVIAAYVVTANVLTFLILVGLVATDLVSISDECIDRDLCSASDKAVLWAMGIGMIGIPVFCIVQGWRGRLYGCRIRQERSA